MIIGVTGTLGSGKGTVVERLKERGFVHYSVSEFLTEEIRRRGMIVNRDSMVMVANDLRSRFGLSYIVEQLYNKAKSSSKNSVIESIRAIGEVEFLKKQRDFVLLAVDADVETRYSRIRDRGGPKDKISFEDFIANEERELVNENPSKQNLKACIEMSDYKIKNNWTLREFYDKLDKILDQVVNEPTVSRSSGLSCGILSDSMIKRRVQEGAIEIVPFNEKCVQPASYDLHLDNQFKIFRPHKTEVIDTKNPVKDLMEDVDLNGDDCFVLHPGSFALGLIKEKTGVNNKHVGRLEGKSSLARLGLIIHTTAGFLDPGNSLQLTLELFNASPLPIKLYPGMKIAQIAFEELIEPCDKPYGFERGSSYFGADKIQVSDMSKNFGTFNPETGMYDPK